MNNAEDPLVQQLLASPRPRQRRDLVEQIVRQATAQQQIVGWQRALDDFAYAWQLKLASLALCSVLGVFVGQWQATAMDDNELLIGAQLLDSALYTEDL